MPVRPLRHNLESVKNNPDILMIDIRVICLAKIDLAFSVFQVINAKTNQSD
ncbi:hypothetical protein OENI_340027 [Oenococcus oeni]|nr:hypothetical protein OENI_340027 [Oenococcus oeni]